jgi:protein phosphatase
VVCEEKHMGSRAVVIVCRDEAAARKSFGVTGEGVGICYTRTGRRFFDHPSLETEFLTRIHTAASAAGFWDEFNTGWLCLDLRIDAVVGQGAGIVEMAIRRRRCFGAGGARG